MTDRKARLRIVARSLALRVLFDPGTRIITASKSKADADKLLDLVIAEIEQLSRKETKRTTVS